MLIHAKVIQRVGRIWGTRLLGVSLLLFLVPFSLADSVGNTLDEEIFEPFDPRTGNTVTELNSDSIATELFIVEALGDRFVAQAGGDQNAMINLAVTTPRGLLPERLDDSDFFVLGTSLPPNAQAPRKSAWAHVSGTSLYTLYFHPEQGDTWTAGEYSFWILVTDGDFRGQALAKFEVK